MSLADIVALIGEVLALSGVIITFIVCILKIINGVKCLLRSEMLRIYHHNKDAKSFRQYEFENFCLLYKAYKALKGNSFIDEIYEKVTDWQVTT